MVYVARNILELYGFGFQKELENSLEKLIERYKTTFDLCVLQTITSIQVKCVKTKCPFLQV
jgi:hypothetical protein